MTDNATSGPRPDDPRLISGSSLATPPPAMDLDLAARMQRFLDRQIEEGEPGAVVGIYRDGTLMAQAAAGMASLEHQVPLTIDTPFDVASVSKQVSAATILIAVRDGLIDLDEDIRHLVPELHVEAVTLRHCLHHTAGLPDYLTVCDAVGIPSATACNLEVLLSWLGRVDTLDFAPGSSISYSNTGYVAAAIAAERTAGVPFPQLVAANVLTPLGMTDTRARSFVGQVIPGLAFSYSPQPHHDAFLRHEMGDDPNDNPRSVDGDGDLIATIADFAHWHGFLADGRTLGGDIREQMLTRATLADGTVTRYGMGIRHENVGGMIDYGHSGSMWGYTAHSLTEPESGIGVAVFANRDDIDPTDIAWRALRTALDDRDLARPWYAPTDGVALDVHLRADGGLDAADAGQVTRYDPQPDGLWCNPEDAGTIRLHDQTLELVDDLGRTVRFHRMSPDNTPHPDPVGTYREPVRGATISISNDDGHLTLARGTMSPVSLTYTGFTGTATLYECDLGWLRIDTDTPDHVTLVAGTTSLTLHRRT